MIPNRFRLEDQDDMLRKKPSGISLSDINWRGVAVLIVVILLCLVAWILIRDISQLGGDFGSTVMGWLDRARLNPTDKQGFVNFLRLLLTVGFLGILISILSRK